MLPQSKRVEAYLSEHVASFLFTPYYDMATFVELLPIWLKYLHALQMVSEREMQQALTNLAPLIEQIGRLVTKASAIRHQRQRCKA